ncbi:DNA topoisomerase III [Burkholderia diffusa]|uniref:DNA topoisomerase n=1 Tax=Burkholderia diffusa TaxID=488732 RepID=UPI001CAD5579|nr:DNA topoisomerase [Burkholderia diffusa]CAG9260944.1 DNA topoisomerase III [Burkholderia diffusa]
MEKTLIVAEKPSVASDLAKALGGFTKVDSHYERDDAIVAPARGHLVGLTYPEADGRDKWQIGALPLIPDQFQLEVSDGYSADFNSLKKLMGRGDVSRVVNACDAGREGELIFRLIYEKAGCQKPILRMWIQSMVPSSIRKEYENLRPGRDFDHLFDAALCRSEADWIVGINGTRAVTQFLQRKTQRREVSSVGRVQTPTLALPVLREREIAAFVAQDYWEIHATFRAAAGTYNAKWIGSDGERAGGADAEKSGARFFEKAKAQAIAEKCKGQHPTSAVDESNPESSEAPALFDLTALQREANRRYKFSAKKTEGLAQALYEHKATTYPRTDARVLPEDYLETAASTLASFSGTPLDEHAKRVLENNWVKPDSRIFNNAGISDHFAIVPTGQQPAGLSPDEEKIYDLVSRRFIAVFHPPAQFEMTTRTTIVASETFIASGKVLVEPGWLVVYGSKTVDGENAPALCRIADGDSVKTDSIDLKALQTKPPKRYSEATLLSAMEHAGRQVDDKALRAAMKAQGLGRPATRAEIIEGLLADRDRKKNPKEPYLVRDDNELVPTPKAMTLMAALEEFGIDFLVSPIMTGEWEHKLLRMEKGEYHRSVFMQEIAALTTTMVGTIRSSYDGLPEPVAATLDVPCPKCGGGIALNGRAWECNSCDFRLWKEVGGRPLTDVEATTLLKGEQTAVLSGFSSRTSGKRFSAALKFDLEAGKPVYVFEDGPVADGKAKQLKSRCPNCSSAIDVRSWHYACTGCEFKISTEIAGRKISESEAETLITKHETGTLAGFVGRNKRKFSTKLKLDKSTGKVSFEFEDRK